jgi:hypothetical protein
MSSITRIDRAITTLRQQLIERSATGKSVMPQDTPGLRQTEKNERSRQVRQRIKKGLAGLDLTLANDQERGASIFLETVLADEFGTELLSDPAFHNLMADVRTAMLADKSTQKDLVSMLIELRDS